MKTIQDWLDQLFNNTVIGYGEPLSRVADYVDALGLSDLPGCVITVTGTNGKGSVVALLESIYLAAGYRVAATTSPHILDFCERLTLNGIKVSDASVLDAFERINRVRGTQAINACDFMYLALFLCIKEFKADVSIIEAGVGGRLDLANLFDSQAAIITTIDLDHSELLGASRGEVAFEKAHLARRDCPLICGDDNPPSTLYDVTNEKGAVLYQLNNAFYYKSHANSWVWVGPNKTRDALPKPRIKLQNAATALMAIECLYKHLPVSEEAICNGLISVHIPGRFEIIERPSYTLILDVAHNPQACRELAAQLRQLPIGGKTYVVFGMAVNKDLNSALQALVGVADAWFIGELVGRASYTPQKIQQELQALGVENCYTCDGIRQALQRALAQVTPGDRVVVCGSFMAVQAAKLFFGE